MAAPAAGAYDSRGQSETLVTCVKEPGPGPVELSALGGNGADLRFIRSGDEMVIFEENYLHGVVPCGPGALALDEITEVRLVNDDVEYDSSFVIDLSQGPLGPGAGSDEGTPEIEFDLPIQTSFNYARFEGVGARPESISIGRSGDAAVADLNGDGDIDVRWLGAEGTLVGGTPGDDRIDLTGESPAFSGEHRPYSVAIDAGAGNDEVLLASGDANDRVLGGSGNDTFRLQGPSQGFLDGGEGYDTLVLEAGSDIHALGDLEAIEKVVEAGRPVNAGRPAVRIVAARTPESLAGLKRRGVRLRVLCSQDCRARVQISTGRRAVAQGMPWVLRTRFVALAAGRAQWVTLHLRPVARRAVADNRPQRFNIKNWARATFADGSVREDSFVSEIG